MISKNSNWVSKFLNIFVKTLQKSYRNSKTYHSRKRFCTINMSSIIDLKSALELLKPDYRKKVRTKLKKNCLKIDINQIDELFVSTIKK